MEYEVLEASVKVNPAYLPAVYGGFITIARTAGAAAILLTDQSEIGNNSSLVVCATSYCS